jgi:hypothetical protein
LYKVHFKPTHSFSIISRDSYHPPHVFSNLLFGELLRFCTHSSSYDDFIFTKKVVSRHWLKQGYTRTQIRTACKKVHFLTQRYPNKWDPGFFPCDCHICKYSFYCQTVNNPSSVNAFSILHRMCCTDVNIIYLIVCKKCGIRYVGQTCRQLRRRIAEHVNYIKNKSVTPVSAHFQGPCFLSDFSFTALEHCPKNSKRLKKEDLWMRRLCTLRPRGLNEATTNDNPLRLVLPYSDCARKVLRLCQNKIDFADVSGAFTMHANLRKRLRHEQC